MGNFFFFFFFQTALQTTPSILSMYYLLDTMCVRPWGDLPLLHMSALTVGQHSHAFNFSDPTKTLSPFIQSGTNPTIGVKK